MALPYLNTKLKFLLLTVLAISLQFPLFVSIRGVPIRFFVSDALIPLLCVLFLGTSQGRTVVRQEWGQYSFFRWVSLSLFTCFMYLGFSLFTSWYQFGSVSSWGLYTRFLGFGVLLSYFFFFYFLTFLRSKLFFSFVRINIILFCLSYLGMIVSVVFRGASAIDPIVNQFYMPGFLGNATSTSFFGLFILLGLLFYWEQIKWPFPSKEAALSILIFLILITFSRSALFILTVFFVFGLWKFRHRFRLIGCFVISIIANFFWQTISLWDRIYIFVSGILNFQQNAAMLSESQNMSVDQAQIFRSADTSHAHILSDLDRLQELHMCLNGLLDNPFFGKGLGYFYSHHLSLIYNISAVIHNTFLWVLYEMGVVGLIIFGFTYGIFLKTLIKQKSYLSCPYFCVFFGHFIFLFYSLMHDVLYQRILWIFLGATFMWTIRERKKIL